MSWTSINRIFEFYSLIKVSLPGDNFYVWLYTPVPWYRSYPKLTILSTVLAVTLSPIWPAQIRLFYLAVYIIYMIYKNWLNHVHFQILLVVVFSHKNWSHIPSFMYLRAVLCSFQISVAFYYVPVGGSGGAIGGVRHVTGMVRITWG